MVLRNSLDRIAFASVSIAPLVWVRVAFGAMMLFSTARFMALGWIEDHYTDPVFHFTYYGAGWVKPLGVNGMYFIHTLMLMAAAGILLGWRYRLSAVVFFLTFTYTELIDLTYYLNHYYAVSLIAFLLILVPAHASFSLDVRRNPACRRTHVPAWTVNLFRFQLGIVYGYAGLAKLHPEWLLNAMPLRIWLPAHDDLPLIGWAFRYPATAWLFSWAGMLYDTSIPFLLLWKRTRLPAYVAVVLFHLLTGLLFQIGVFPLVMIALTPVFFSDEWHRSIQQWFSKQAVVQHLVRLFPAKPAPLTFFRVRTEAIVPFFLAGWIAFQLLFPWRFLLYPGNLFWTEQGYRFGWRVMLMEKAGTATFYVRDACTGREGIALNREFLNSHQEKQMAFQPDMILQFAHHLARHYRSQGMCDPAVRAEVWVTLNGRPSQLLIDPSINLAAQTDRWAAKPWILPLKP